jgi:hypothetical protein
MTHKGYSPPAVTVIGALSTDTLKEIYDTIGGRKGCS